MRVLSLSFIEQSCKMRQIPRCSILLQKIWRWHRKKIDSITILKETDYINIQQKITSIRL